MSTGMIERGFKMDYSKTINLPKTDFPMRANLPNREPEIQAWWDEIGIYEKVQERQQRETEVCPA